MEQRVCRQCLLREMSEADGQRIQVYIDAIKPRDRVDVSVYEQRLALCRACERLLSGTCMSCGCYVEIRAFLKTGRCPKKVWERNLVR